MDWFDWFRYIFAFLFVVAFFPAFGFWFAVHPFIRFWRRLGAAWTLTLTLGVGYVVAGFLCYRFRGFLLAREWGTNYWLIAAAVPLLVVTGIIQRRRKKHLGMKILVGVPEIEPEKHQRKLLTEGIYGRIRHPRYVEAAIGFTAWALILNYLAVYVLVAVMMVLLYLTVIIEERELRQYFGDAYVEYCARVPRFIPRRSPR